MNGHFLHILGNLSVRLCRLIFRDAEGLQQNSFLFEDETLPRVAMNRAEDKIGDRWSKTEVILTLLLAVVLPASKTLPGDRFLKRN